MNGSTGLWARLKGGATPDATGSAAMPPSMPQRIGGFTLSRLVAQGAQGEVFLAHEPTTGLPVAIKTVRMQAGEVARERFLNESTAAARLNHPDIVRTLSAGMEDDTQHQRTGWIAMEWVSGLDLGRTLADVRQLPLGIALNVAARVAAALGYSHRMGVVHRDIKPGNILIQWPSGVVKVSDFGCAHLDGAARSRSGLMIGSLAYMAPEQLAGATVDGRTDLYALGAVLFEMIAGRPPFEADNLGQWLSRIGRDEPPCVKTLRPETPKPVADLVARLLTKLPAQRPPDGDVLARELCMMALTCWNAPAPTRSGPRHNP